MLSATHSDKLEFLVDDKKWALPKYRELLFFADKTVRLFWCMISPGFSSGALF